MDRFKITLRVASEELDPDSITTKLGCSPTKSREKGNPTNSSPGASRLAKKHRWSLSIDSDICGDGDVEDGVKILLAKLTADLELWNSLSKVCEMDLFCGVFMETDNRGFGLSSEVCRMLAERHLSIGFDVYFDPPQRDVQDDEKTVTRPAG